MHFLGQRACTSSFRRLWHWWWWFYLGILGHHSLETNSNTFDNSKEDGASDSTISHRFVASSYGE
jgi:hypothetical protein